MRIELFGRPYNRTDRVQWTLEELGVPYKYRKLDVFALEHRSGEFRDLYGLTRLPFVRLDDEVRFECDREGIHCCAEVHAAEVNSGGWTLDLTKLEILNEQRGQDLHRVNLGRLRNLSERVASSQ